VYVCKNMLPKQIVFEEINKRDDFSIKCGVSSIRSGKVLGCSDNTRVFRKVTFDF